MRNILLALLMIACGSTAEANCVIRVDYKGVQVTRSQPMLVSALDAGGMAWYRVNWKLDSSGPDYCPAFNLIVTLALDVSIHRQEYADRCSYAETWAHEQRHVEISLLNMERHKPLIEGVVRNFNNREAVNIRAWKIEFSKAVQAVIDSFLQVNKADQEAFDYSEYKDGKNRIGQRVRTCQNKLLPVSTQSSKPIVREDGSKTSPPSNRPKMSREETVALVGYLETRLKTKPDDEERWRLLGRAYDLLGDTAKSIAAYRRALALSE
jgi:tetratricopeptide (TPR) repeat protein